MSNETLDERVDTNLRENGLPERRRARRMEKVSTNLLAIYRGSVYIDRAAEADADPSAPADSKIPARKSEDFAAARGIFVGVMVGLALWGVIAILIRLVY